MANLVDHLKNITAADLGVDPQGRLVIDNPEIVKAVTSAVPNVRQAVGRASNNCDCSMPQRSAAEKE